MGGAADLYSVTDRLIVTTRHTDARLEAFEDRDAQRNLRRYRALSAGFGVMLLGGAVAYAGIAIGTWADIHHRGPTKGESIAKFSLTVLGGVLAGGGALFSFIKGFGENDSDQSWLRTWRPARGCAAGAGELASWLGLALSPKTKTRRTAEVAALMHAWSTLVSRPGTWEQYHLEQETGYIINFRLNTAFNDRDKLALERALSRHLRGQAPSVVHPDDLATYHAVRLMWKYFNPGDTRVPSIEQSEQKLRQMGFTTQANVQSRVMERLKLAKIGVEEPDEARRAVDRAHYLPGGGEKPRLGDSEVP